MQRQFTHNLSSSFNLYLERELLQKGQAYTNTTGNFYFADNQKINNLNLAQSQNPQWVYDSSISGALIPDGIFINNSFVPRDTSGVKLDFTRGRSYYEGNSNNISGFYAKKDLNWYFQTEDETTLVLEKLFNGQQDYFAKTGATANVVAPCVLVNLKSSNNTPFALGGEDDTTAFYQAVIISDNNYIADGALSIFRDLNETTFPIVNFEDIPFNIYGDLKDNTFNYLDLKTGDFSCAYIYSINTQPVKAAGNLDRDRYFIGYCEFQVSNYRFPRINTT